MNGGVEVDTDAREVALRRFERDAVEVAADASFDSATGTAERTRENVPRRSGRLAASVSAVRVGTDARVAMAAPYAAWIEYGGSRGRPFVSEGRYLGPAARAEEREMVRRATAGIARAVARL